MVNQSFRFEYRSPNSCSEQLDDIQESVTIEWHGKDLSAYTVIEAFEKFLRACGYTVNGHIDIVED